MGRKSSLTDEQWLEVERRHLVNGESINSLAGEFGVNESSIRRKIKPTNAESPNSVNSLQRLAQEKFEADRESKRIAEAIAELPYAKQNIVFDLERQMVNAIGIMAAASEEGAKNTLKLTRMVSRQIDRISEEDPMSSENEIKAASAFQRMANASSEVPINMMRIFKDANKQVDTQDQAQLLKEIAERLPN